MSLRFIVVALVFLAGLVASLVLQVPLLVALAPILLLSLVPGRFPLGIFSPVWVCTLSISLSALMGLLVFGSGVSVVEQIFAMSRESARSTMTILGLSGTLIVLGALAYSWLRADTIAPARIMFEVSRWRGINHLAAAAAALPLILAALFWSSIWSRVTYLNAPPGSLEGMLGPLTILGLVSLGFLSRTRNPAVFGVVVLASVAEILILLSLGSRIFAMFPLALAIGNYLHQADRRAETLILAAVPVSLLLLPIPLTLRALDEHGLVNYLPAITSTDLGLGTWRAVWANLTIGFPITGITILGSNSVPVSNILISVNPLPGTLAGWYEILESMRVGVNFPFSAYGEVWSAGWPLAVGVLLAVGFAFGYFDYRIRKLAAAGQGIAGILIFLLTVLSVLFLSSYNLRNATRPLWYALAVDLATRSVPLIRQGVGRNARSREHTDEADTELTTRVEAKGG